MSANEIHTTITTIYLPQVRDEWLGWPRRLQEINQDHGHWAHPWTNKLQCHKVKTNGIRTKHSEASFIMPSWNLLLSWNVSASALRNPCGDITVLSPYSKLINIDWKNTQVTDLGVQTYCFKTSWELKLDVKKIVRFLLLAHV